MNSVPERCRSTTLRLDERATQKPGIALRVPVRRAKDGAELRFAPSSLRCLSAVPVRLGVSMPWVG